MRTAPRLSARLDPFSPLTTAVHRGRMVAALPALLRRGDHSSRALASAIRSTTLGFATPEERAWLTRIEAWRRRLVAERRLVAQVPTTGGETVDSGRHSVSELASWWSVPPLWGRFLMRLVRQLAPRSCLELGTGFGLSTAYQAAALELNEKGTLSTLDVEGPWATIAEQGLSELGLDERIEWRRGRIAETLGAAVERAAPIDYAYLDAEHTEKATVESFDSVLPSLGAGAVVVLDDIPWTEEMRTAWGKITGRESVARAVDLGRMGVVFVGAR